MERDDEGSVAGARDSVGSTGSDFLSRLEAKLSFMEENMDGDLSPPKAGGASPSAGATATPPRAQVTRTPFSTPAAPSSVSGATSTSQPLFSTSMQPTKLSPYRDRTAELERLAQRSAERKKKRSDRENKRRVESQHEQVAPRQPVFSGQAPNATCQGRLGGAC